MMKRKIKTVKTLQDLYKPFPTAPRPEMDAGCWQEVLDYLPDKLPNSIEVDGDLFILKVKEE